jgi:hypothetical protein
MNARTLTLALALLVPLGARAVAGDLGGVTGTVVNARNGAPMPGQVVNLYRIDEYRGTLVEHLRTNSRGFFADILLPPGHYLAVVVNGELQSGCSGGLQIFDGEVVYSRVSVLVGADVLCSGVRMHPALVDPFATFDVYRIW